MSEQEQTGGASKGKIIAIVVAVVVLVFVVVPVVIAVVAIVGMTILGTQLEQKFEAVGESVQGASELVAPVLE